MTVTATSFVADFPEFGDTTKYPASAINYWLNLAGLLLNSAAWTTLLDIGTELFIAHNLVLEAKAQAEAANGMPPGVTTGPISGKTTDKVSISYDVASGIEPGAGHWNLTIYGTRFMRLVNLVGMGPLQIGPTGCFDPLSSQNAWLGPPTYPSYFP